MFLGRKLRAQNTKYLIPNACEPTKNSLTHFIVSVPRFSLYTSLTLTKPQPTSREAASHTAPGSLGVPTREDSEFLGEEEMAKNDLVALNVFQNVSSNIVQKGKLKPRERQPTKPFHHWLNRKRNAGFYFLV